MKDFKFTIIMAFVVLGAVTAKLCSQPTNPPAKLQSTEAAKRPSPTFADGVQFGLIAMQRNQDVRDLQTLTQIAFGLWQQNVQALARQQQARVATNAAPTNSTASTNAEAPAK